MYRRKTSIAPPKELPISHTNNPLWDIVRTIPGNELDWKWDHVWSPDWTATRLAGKEWIDRKDLCGEYTWAIPDPDSLNFVTEWLSPKAIEIGGGTGYWAWQLSQLGVDILCYDLYPPHLTGQNGYHSPRNENKDKLMGEVRKIFYDVRAGNEKMAAKHPDRVLFLCWPPFRANE